MNVTFAGVTLAKPLTVAFRTAGKSSPDAIPVVAHRQADGTWDLTSATTPTADRMQVSIESFSPHIPAWLHPSEWLNWFGNRMASLIGGRTAPLPCSGGGPAWATLVKNTDAVHTCLKTSVDQGSGKTRAEVQIKSNRGTALEVDMPRGAAYTWVDGQPWGVRSAIWRDIIHQDPNLMALLPAGAEMTAGYTRPDSDEGLDFQASVTGWSLAYTLVGDIMDTLTGVAANKTGSKAVATLYLAIKCSSAVNFTNLSARRLLKMATFSSALRCGAW